MKFSHVETIVAAQTALGCTPVHDGVLSIQRGHNGRAPLAQADGLLVQTLDEVGAGGLIRFFCSSIMRTRKNSSVTS